MTADRTITRLLATRRERNGADAAIVHDDDSVTYVELDDRSRALAGRLVAAGVSKADRVGLVMPNGIEWAVTALAVMRIGAVLVPLSTLLRPPELLAQLRVAAVTHLIAIPGYRRRSYFEDLDSVAPGVQEVCAQGGRHPAIPSLRSVWPSDALPGDPVDAGLLAALEAAVRPVDDLAILFTSGSRGTPKGVVHTHANALRAVASGLDVRCIDEGERLYIPMPFFWTGGFASGLLSALVAGATLLTEADPAPERTIAFLERERATLFRGWPDQAARIAADPSFAAADLSSLRQGSLPAILPPERRPAPGARANVFGMTESFGPYCGDRLDTDMPKDKWGSCGRPFAGVEVRITDPDDGTPLPAGVDGEIELRSPNMMRGICGRERSTVFTKDGYYRTADLGRVDADGYLWYSGRVDDMFKVKGATVYPSEVEAALRSIAGVAQAFATDVVGDEGETRVGALVVAPGDTDTAGLLPAARERLSAFKVPTLWHVTDDPDAVPRMPTGKVDKAALQDLLRAKGSPEPAVPASPPSARSRTSPR